MIGLHTVTIQCYRGGKPSTVMTAHGVIGRETDKATLLKRAMRFKNVKDTKTAKWVFVSSEMTKKISE